MKAARAVALLTAVLAASCGAPLMKLPVGPGEPAPDGPAALAQATAACRTITTISAEVGVSGSVTGSRVRGRLLTGLASPDSLYMEAPAPFGAPLFVLGASRGDATLILPRDRRVLEHGRPDEVLAAVTGVPLTPADLKATLTGCVADMDDSAQARAIGANWRVLEGDERHYLRREHGSSPWRLVSTVREGAEGWRADYSGFVGGLPRAIHLVSTTPRRFDVRLQLSQVDVNGELDASTFRVAIPPGVSPITIDELRAGGPLSR